MIATIELPGKPEAAVADLKTRRIYDNIEDKNEVAVIDCSKHEVVNSWPISPGEGASGLALIRFTVTSFSAAIMKPW